MSYYAMVLVVNAEDETDALTLFESLDVPEERFEFLGKPVLVEEDANGSFEHLDQWETVTEEATE